MQSRLLSLELDVRKQDHEVGGNDPTHRAVQSHRALAPIVLVGLKDSATRTS